MIFYAIPTYRMRESFERNIPLELHVQHNLNNVPLLLPCPALDVANLTKVYEGVGICHSVEQYEGVCPNATHTSTTWVDLTYEREGTIFRYPNTLAETPMPFNYLRYEKICARDWLFDPVGNVFTDGNRYGGEYEGPLFLVGFLGSGFGLFVFASVVVSGYYVCEFLRWAREYFEKSRLRRGGFGRVADGGDSSDFIALKARV